MTKTAEIAALNDELRCKLGAGVENGEAHMTSGVAALPDQIRASVMEQVRTFDTFTKDNDPHREHDFGKVVADGVECFWKIDYYNTDLSGGSPDAANRAVTKRVMTVMLCSEY